MRFIEVFNSQGVFPVRSLSIYCECSNKALLKKIGAIKWRALIFKGDGSNPENQSGLCRDRTYDPVIKSRIATFNFVKALLHSLSEPANAFSASHRALPTCPSDVIITYKDDSY